MYLPKGGKTAMRKVARGMLFMTVGIVLVLCVTALYHQLGTGGVPIPLKAATAGLALVCGFGLAIDAFWSENEDSKGNTA